MAGNEADLDEWWSKLSEDQQGLLKRAVRAYPVDSSIPSLLLSTGCPAKESWTATKFTSVDGPHAIALHGLLAEFIEKKVDG